ncbi:MAG TPA: hypothetical protein VGB48_00740 [Allosphingosinicella sp.]|jgi:hypothetical protein
MESLQKALGNAPTYVVLYLVGMIPTYFLPYVGSNSIVMTAAHDSVGQSNGPFWFHLLFLLGLCGLTWLRGGLIDKRWLVIFPVLAAFFDLMPGFNWIPLVPTVMHLLAIILAVAGTKASTAS